MVHGPIENFLISHLCRTAITPNQLTVITNIVAWAATFLFATGHLGWGTILALAVGVLDGLDGKQARVKIETSKVGKLEHWFDAFFENSWWIAIAYHFQTSGRLPGAFVYLVLLMGAEAVAALAKWSVIRSCGRTLDEFGEFNRLVRLIGGRRNIYIWIFALGILFGIPDEASRSWLGGELSRLPSRCRGQSSRSGLSEARGASESSGRSSNPLTPSATAIRERMIGLQQVLRVFDSKPWVAHLYVTEQCNLDCHYCNEYDNSIPHPAVADLKKWMDHIRALGVVRIGFQGGEPLKHPDIVELVRYAKSLGFCR